MVESNAQSFEGNRLSKMDGLGMFLFKECF